MGDSLTREERQQARQRNMPGELADLHWHLEEELVWLHLNWKEYKSLYATNEKRVGLLNATAPNFFAHLEDLVWRETLLHLCRLTDPPKSVGKRNLTVRRLPDAVTDAQLRPRVEEQVDAAAKAAQFARDWRNRRLAHRSLDYVLAPQLKPLQEASRKKVESALLALREPMNTLSVHYEDVHHDYEGVIAAFSGAQALLYYLSSGLVADEARKASGERWSPPHW